MVFRVSVYSCIRLADASRIDVKDQSENRQKGEREVVLLRWHVEEVQIVALKIKSSEIAVPLRVTESS